MLLWRYIYVTWREFDIRLHNILRSRNKEHILNNIGTDPTLDIRNHHELCPNLNRHLSQPNHQSSLEDWRGSQPHHVDCCHTVLQHGHHSYPGCANCWDWCRVVSKCRNEHLEQLYTICIHSKYLCCHFTIRWTAY